MKSLYFDYAAATPLDTKVLKAMQPYFINKFYNPSAIYLVGKVIKTDIEKARMSIANHLGVLASEIVFTGGGTEANNLAIKGVMEEFPGKHLLVSAIEHESIHQPANLYNTTELPVDKQGLVRLANLEKSITEDTVLISIMYANNEIGTIQPLKEIAGIIKKVRDMRKASNNNLPLYFHTDACQATNYLDLHINRLGVDMLTLNGGKIYGPKQLGLLYISKNVRINPQILGGGQELGRRSGTENVPGIIGFAGALQLAQTKRKNETARVQKLQNVFFEELKNLVPTATVNGSLKHRLPNNVHITIPGQDNEILMMKLDEMGIQCAVGSACSASNDKPSHVLAAIGLPEKDIRASLRFTMGRGTTQADVKKCVKAVAVCVN